jgi:GT2 family glycosyltransferase/tetratricopeptide (TPR) repeat protein/2-polyprenyl-3-methyl-5-hydroxy-6-metoxy-1,4-benzoquinol methylase
MGQPKVGLIYDDRVRPDTTGGYCLRALRKITQVSRLFPDQLNEVPDAFDLFLCVDDGLDYSFPARLHPSAFWAIDTHLNFERSLRRARGFDFVFAAQKEGAKRLRADGIACCEWLPLACDPEIHRRLEVEKVYDVAFVGHIFPGPRQQLLEQVKRHFPNSFIGEVPHTQMAEIHSRARIVINCCLNNDLNMRVFEALSCGALLVTNHLNDNGQEELFQDRVHLVEYHSPEEALELIDYYLRNSEERKAIAEVGHREAINRHTYLHRMKELLDRVKRYLEEQKNGARIVVGGQLLPNGSRQPDSRGNQYFHWPRPDLLELVPEEAKRVLDVGCAAGAFGESLKRRQKCEVVGIELDAQAAAEAKGRLDKAVEADVEALDLSPLGKFDAIVCGDILEHLREPGEVLCRLHGALNESGVLVASFPNVRHMEVVQRMVEGNWTYEPAGLLDRGHLRFFTRRSAEQLLEDAGFEVVDVRAIPGQGYAEWEQMGAPGEIRAGRMGISGLAKQEAQEFFVSQWLMVARAAPRKDWGLTSIVVVTWNELPYTQLCIESLRKYTHLPYELIVVDNGSTDGSLDWLRSQADVRLIANPTNLGFPKAANQGIKAANGENILLLNNDTVVTPGWLRRMLERLYSRPEVGMVGPLSNFVSGPQQIDVPYKNLIELDGFAWDWGKTHRGQSESIDRLVGFCLLMKREVIEKIGLLDERFEMGCFEDDDLCRRALEAGYELLICKDAFVHHFGGRTFIGNQLPFSQIIRENQRRFRDKWSGAQVEPAASEPPAISQPWKIGRHASGGLVLQPKEQILRPHSEQSISLCMIVRDEEAHIADCLKSIKPYVDEMIVVDTGSKDRTLEIARSLGAKVIETTWSDSFSAARNVSLEHATGDWIIWMDADDVIDEESGKALRQCIEQADERILGFIAQVHCPAGPGEEGETIVDHVKLFRNRSDLRFELRIHEQILPSLRRAGGEIARAPIHVRHTHYDHSPEGQQKKRQRDQRLLELDLAENPEHPFVHFNMGMTALHEKDYPRAITHLRKSVDLSAPQDSQVRKAYALLASAYRALDKPQEALQVCQEARKVYPDDIELLFNEALAWQMAGDLQRAEQTFLHLLSNKPKGDYLASVDTGIFSYKARHNLGAVCEQLGKPANAEGCWRQVVAEQSDFLPSWLALGELLISQGRKDDLENLTRQAERCDSVMAYLLRGRAALKQGDLLKAEASFRDAVEKEPHTEEGCRFLSHTLLQRGERREVESILRHLIELAPDDGEAHHNLASLLLEQGRASEAVMHYQHAIRLRPQYLPSQQMLQEALKRVNAGVQPPGSLTKST